MQFDFIQDLGLSAIIILITFVIRTRIIFIQKLFIPVSIISGLIALLIGQNGLGYISFSDQLASYPGIMIAFLFGSLPFTFEIRRVDSFMFKKATIQMGGATISILLLQWGLGLLFGMTVLNWLFPNINSSFGSILAAGFFGGHGTAAAIGESFAANLNWEEATSLAMTSATVGLFSATVGGIIMIQWGLKNHKTAFIKGFDELPKSLKTGLLTPGEQGSIGKATFSNITVDPLLMHIVLVLFVGSAGLFLTHVTKPFLNGYTITAFSFAFIVGLLLKWLLIKLKWNRYFDTQVMHRICGSFADLIVIFGIASINISIVMNFAGALLLIFILGILLAIFSFKYMGPRQFTSFWFEKSLFLWGMCLGVTAIGIALLRIVDPESKSNTLPTFALGYICVTPFEVACLVFFPILASLGFQWHFIFACLLLSLLILILLKSYNQKSKG